MTATIELNSIAQLDEVPMIVLGLSFISLLNESIQIVNVASMMSGVMELHGLSGDNGLK